jgi:twitching motility protein PilT
MQKKLLDKILAHGVKTGASDIHFLVGDRPSYRIDGSLHPVKYKALSASDTRRICETLAESNSAIGDLDEIREIDCSYSIDGVARFRVNIYRQRGSLCCILRVIPTEVAKLAELGLPDRVRGLASEERGLVLVTGATGSGKSSTLAAMIDDINRTRAAHILTIEDPIEFLHSNHRSSISQREVGPDTRTFTTALRASLRQDPDVILVGEMRDAETIDIALKAAETGHMVFSTVHTTDTAKTIGRLVSVFPSQEQHAARIRLADNLKGVISQRLLPRADGKGRAVAAEIMVVTKTVQEYIKDPERAGDLKDVIERGRDEYGMQSFDQHLTELYRKGIVELAVARSAASNPSDFERALNFSAAPPDEEQRFESDGASEAELQFVSDEQKPEAESIENLLVGEDESGDYSFTPKR